MSKKNVIIDCDPGVDDSIALFLAGKSDDINVRLITTVAGNKDIDNITNNTLHLMEKFGYNIPVAKGSKKPLSQSNNFPKAHGKLSGLGEYSYSEVNLKPIKLEASEAIYNVLVACGKDKATLLCLAPLTNIARTLINHPDSKKYIERIVFMGGQKDNTDKQTPYKEFNSTYDQEATGIILNSGIKLTLVPMDLGHIAYLTEQEVLDTHFTSEIGEMFARMFLDYKDGHVLDGEIATHDSCALMEVLRPDIVKKEKCHVSIEHDTTNNFDYIKCEFNKKPNAEVCIDIDVREYKNIFFNALLNS